ncbi:hypothetical protein EON68_03260 [archaeon]|nr:MAG: hypothetical protein EON68_03260 [archaeon]
MPDSTAFPGALAGAGIGRDDSASIRGCPDAGGAKFRGAAAGKGVYGDAIGNATVAGTTSRRPPRPAAAGTDACAARVCML